MGSKKQVRFSEMGVHGKKEWEGELTGQTGNKLWKALNVVLRNEDFICRHWRAFGDFEYEIVSLRTEKGLKRSVGPALYINV